MGSRAGAAVFLTIVALLGASCATPTTEEWSEWSDEAQVMDLQSALRRHEGPPRRQRPSEVTDTVAAPTTTETPTTAPTTTAAPTTAAPTTAAPAPTTAPAPRSPAGFVHPGVFIDRNGLDTIRDRVRGGQQPWAGAFDRIARSGGSIKTAARPVSYRFSSLDYQPAPVSVVQAGGASSTRYMATHPELGLANVGHIEHLDDAIAAYTHSLMWYLTGNELHALKAIEIMNAWSYRLTEIKFDQPRRLDTGGQVYDNGKLQAGWAGSLVTRAAEIIRHTYGKWSDADVARYETMLRRVYLPLVITSWSNGSNWLMTFAEATINIGVFLDDRAVFDAGVASWRRLAPTTVYLRSDGSRPLAPVSWLDDDARIRSYWFSPSSYPEGLQQETLRDISHMTLGLGAMANAAETAWLQGVDLYAEQRTRFVAGFERNADYVRQYLAEFSRLGSAPDASWVPTGFPGTRFRTGGLAYRQGWEVAYHHFASRLGIALPNTAAVLRQVRPGGPALHLAWDTLTHGT